jgi:hypothetical protein
MRAENPKTGNSVSLNDRPQVSEVLSENFGFGYHGLRLDDDRHEIKVEEREVA